MSQHRSGYGSLDAHPPASKTDHEMNSSTDMGSKGIGESKDMASRERSLKEKVNLHFENHWQKWKRKKFRVWKVVFHVLLVILVTIQASETIRT